MVDWNGRRTLSFLLLVVFGPQRGLVFMGGMGETVLFGTLVGAIYWIYSRPKKQSYTNVVH